ncbi:MAG: AAA family ATPase [Gloeobacterales cyanobacterium]|jgi:type II secretory pathway predicted ATPase ExeA
MLTEVMEHYGLGHEFHKAGYYETAHQRQMFKEIKAAIAGGKLVAITGVIGAGKTITLRRLHEALEKEGKILVCKSLSVDRERTTLSTLFSALFYDLSPSDKDLKIPTQGEKRERELRDLIKKGKKPVVLFIDDGHGLHSRTMIGLKRLIELVEDCGGKLSVLVAGHPKLRNDLRRPTMEEIGSRAVIFELDSIAASQREYIEWLFETCSVESAQRPEMITVEAIDLLTLKLRTPLQIEHYLTLAFEAAYKAGGSPVDAEVVESVLSKQLDDLEPTLTRHGYSVKDLAEQFSAKPAEIRSLFRGELDPKRVQELQDQMLKAGLPI